jgi:phage regulator Rha-like protein
MAESLVFSAPNRQHGEPFTTSDIIAKGTENSYRSVQRLIEFHKKALETFGIMRSEITLSGKRGRPKKVYRMNEPQATLLITFMSNTAIVVKFKVELVRQFFEMRAALQKQQIARAARKPIRRELTDAVQADPNHGKWDYLLLTNLAYKSAVGKTAAQIRREHGVSCKAIASDYLTGEEIREIAKKESQIAVLKEMGMDYREIKDIVERHAGRRVLCGEGLH